MSLHARWLLLAMLWVRPGTASAEFDANEFDRQVAAVLGSHCLECHNATERKGGLDLSRSQTALTGGDSGAVIVPGRPEESLLIERVAANEMPPQHPLSDTDQALLRRWIEGGAVWGTDPIDPFRFSTEKRAGYDWWSLQPLQPSPLSAAKDVLADAFVRGPIDALVLQRLRENNLPPSPAADRRALLRRLSFDLRGLPPTPEEVQEFLADTAPDAYERLVDRWLSSPAYGERWARHWLDVARFGESQGFERDKLRSNSWRYRDWVIDAWNQDLPYDEFARRQIAGDVLAREDASSVIATGFLVAGPFDEVGQTQQSAAMKAVVRQDELEDIVSVVGETFLGLTVHCARCHDHKFDPITQQEYYQLTAALGGVRHGQPRAVDDEIRDSAIRGLDAVAARIRRLEDQLALQEQPLRERILDERKARTATIEPPRPMARWEFDQDLQDSLGRLHGEAKGQARLEGDGLVLDGASFVASSPLTSDLSEKTLEAWVTLTTLEQRGGAVIGVQSLDGHVFDAIVFGEQEPRHWMAGSNNFARTQSFGGPEEVDADRPVHIALVYDKEGRITAYRDGQPYGKPYQSNGLVTFKAGQSQVVFGLRHSPPGGNRLLTGRIEQAHLYDRALSAEEVAASAGAPSRTISEAELLAALTAEQREQRENWRFELEQLRSQEERYNEAKVYAVEPREPETTYVLLRGSTATPGETVAARGIKALVGVQPEFGLDSSAPEAERRIKLARWISEPANPLFARVIVNRLWHYHFGVGLVDTPNDFGFNGGRPSHPELMDWLAHELIRRDWSLKAIQRDIVTSATYRQASRFDAARASVDAGNRWLWRKTPLRLDAEVVRDAMLHTAGTLNSEMCGPGYHDFRTFVFNSQFYEMRDPVGATFQRRSLYRTWVRSGRNPFLDVFDCPDPSAKAPRRAVTTTPLQALSLLNNSFVLRTADSFAKRIEAEAATDPEARVRKAYELALGRDPETDELSASTAFIQQHGLSAFCRVLFNSNEFLYVD